MRFLKRLHTYIPGFRQLKSDSMVLAATYYGGCLFVLLRYWAWGIAALALPFLVFGLVELRSSANRKRTAAMALVAGLVVLLGVSAALLWGSPPNEDKPVAVVIAARSTPTATVSTPASSTVLAATPKPANAQYAFVASKTGKTFHLPGCPYAKAIKPENLIGFQTREEALAAGLKPCAHCKP